MVSLRPLPALWCITTIAIVLHVVAIVVERAFGVPRTSGALRQLDLNAEANLTAWFGSVLILACAAVAGTVALAARTDEPVLVRRWAVLAGLLLVMSVDESAQLHDLATAPLRHALGTDLGPFHFAWVLPALVVVVVAAAYLAPLVRSLRPRERARLLTAAATYLAGAVLLEMVGGLVVDVDPLVEGYTLPYLAAITVEESCELLGSVLLLAALLDIAGRRHPHVLLAIAADDVGARVDLGPPGA
jgi:hypothetical protein